MDGYLEKRGVKSLFKDLYREVLQSRPDDPCVHLMRFLAKRVSSRASNEVDGAKEEALAIIAAATDRATASLTSRPLVGTSRTRLRLKSALATDAELQGMLTTAQQHSDAHASAIEQAHREASELVSTLNDTPHKEMATNLYDTLSTAARTASEQRAEVAKCEIEVTCGAPRVKTGRSRRDARSRDQAP